MLPRIAYAAPSFTAFTDVTGALTITVQRVGLMQLWVALTNTLEAALRLVVT